MLLKVILRKFVSIHMNAIVRAYIISESLLWSAWSFLTPILAVFVVRTIPHANVAIAASSVSVYLLSRVIFELFSGRFLVKRSDKEKLEVTIWGMALISIAYIGFVLCKTIPILFYLQFLIGMGLGIASPAKNSLFSTYLDKNKEAEEWGISDAISFTCMAIATAVGGVIAKEFGFTILFLLAGGINFIAIVPYALYIRRLTQ